MSSLLKGWVNMNSRKILIKIKKPRLKKNLVEGIFSISFLILGFSFFQQNELKYIENQYSKNLLQVPTCIDQSNIKEEDKNWTYFPSTPYELNTNIPYSFLAGELIKAGAVDASECPLGGLWPSGFANACGVNEAREIVYKLQNIYDEDILKAGYDIGVPPVMLKQLIRYESQFWPGQYGPYHFGLSHLTFVGASTSLQWNPLLYEKVCLDVYGGPCPISYSDYDPITDLTLSGNLLKLLDAECSDCEYNIDIDKAKDSIYYIADSLMGYCRQTSQIIFNVTENLSSYYVDYGTIWKLTLMNYNSGPYCVFDAVEKAFDFTEGPFNWDHITNNTSGDLCLRGLNYANQITDDYYLFFPESED